MSEEILNLMNFSNISYEMMSVIIAALFTLIIIIILLYMTMKEREVAKKIAQLEHSIEAINKDIYKMQKSILEDKKLMESKNNAKENLENKEIKRDIKEVKNEINSLQHGLQSDREYFEDRILTLEERLRSLGHFNTPSQQRNENQILDLFKNGYTIDAISKELRITKSEVEFVLKLSELHKNNKGGRK